MDDMDPNYRPDLPSFPYLALSTILDYVDSSKDLLSWRLVLPELTEKATKMLEKRVHSEFVQWNRYDYPEWRAASPIPREVRLLPTNVGPLVVGELFPNVNPLMSSSLHLIDRGTDIVEEAEMGMVFLYRLLSTHGSFLTSLSINIKPTRTANFMNLHEVRELLGHCPNLEAIRIQGEWKVDAGDPDKDVLQVPFPHLPKLTYFKSDEPFHLFPWFLSNLSHQLTHLDSGNEFILPFTRENYPQKEGVVGAPFQKLTTLKLTHAMKFFSDGGTPIPMQLERLSIIYPFIPLTEKQVCNFVSRFRHSLTELTLEDMGEKCWYKVAEQEIHGHTNFPNLLKFGYYEELSTSGQRSCVQTAKEHFLPFFPKLEELDVVFKTSRCTKQVLSVEDAKAYVERNQLWSFCPTLKQISFLEYFPIHPNEEPVANVVYKFTKPE